jgi:hypothetical protein
MASAHNSSSKCIRMVLVKEFHIQPMPDFFNVTVRLQLLQQKQHLRLHWSKLPIVPFQRFHCNFPKVTVIDVVVVETFINRRTARTAIVVEGGKILGIELERPPFDFVVSLLAILIDNLSPFQQCRFFHECSSRWRDFFLDYRFRTIHPNPTCKCSESRNPPPH